MKTSLNLKNLELESISGEYEEAQKIIASSERKITDLELTGALVIDYHFIKIHSFFKIIDSRSLVSLLERRLETEREQVNSFRATGFFVI